jgi:hypothetical protein
MEFLYVRMGCFESKHQSSASNEDINKYDKMSSKNQSHEGGIRKTEGYRKTGVNGKSLADIRGKRLLRARSNPPLSQSNGKRYDPRFADFAKSESKDNEIFLANLRFPEGINVHGVVPPRT